MGDKCEWWDDDDGVWDTECGETHLFIEGTPFENCYVFCPYCGKVIQENETKSERD